MKLIFLSIFFLSTIYAQTTLCYKNNINNNQINKTIKLDGTACKGKFSANDMLKNGWVLDSSTAVKNKDKYNHIFIFRNALENNILQQTKAAIAKTPIRVIKKKPLVKFDIKEKKSKIYDVTEKYAKIDLANLIVGQTGIVVNTSSDSSIILSKAIVIDSNDKHSTIEFSKSKVLEQNAIPTTNRTPSSGDTFILNHLYNTSLMIVPNKEYKKTISKVYNTQNFLDEDFFASYLKILQNPVPTKKDIQEFCNKQQIGTIFFGINDNLIIVDSLSFKVLDTQKLYTQDKTIKLPFLTKIDEIKRGVWDFGDDKIEDYNKHYLKLLEIKQ